MDQREDMETGPDGLGKVQRACDACRSRKIRCDRGSPCSNCKASKLNCQTTQQAQKAQRQRVHISDEYEKKIDRIEDRLASIEHVLESLATKLSSLDLKGSPESQNESTSTRATRSARMPPSSDSNINSPAPFEGETALNRQSEVARHMLQRAVDNTPSMRNAEVQAALNSLQHIVSHQHDPAPVESRIFVPTFRDKCKEEIIKPSWDAVDSVLDKAISCPTMGFAVTFPFLKLQNFREQFRELLADEQCSAGRRTLLYAVLYNLFTEFGYYPLIGLPNVDFRGYSLYCRAELERAISELDLFQPATEENIIAMILASAYAVEICKPSFCWTLISTAVGLCQSLGYHRISTMKDDDEETRQNKIHLFWFLYVLDKTLALRLGRASNIQDWDLSLPYPEKSVRDPRDGLAMLAKGTDIQLYWIRVAEVQGQCYEKLYSPAAFLRSDEERAHIASELVAKLHQALADREGASVLDCLLIGPGPSASTTSASTGKDTADPSSEPVQAARGFQPSNHSPRTRTFRSEVLDRMYPHASTDPESVDQLVASYESVGDLFHHADIVAHYSIQTLVQRAVNPDMETFNRDCLESARAALAAHQRCSEKFNKKGNEELYSGYLHWSVLQAPFTPFIVVFCNAVSQCSPPDLEHLSRFVDSLQSCRNLSEGADKLYKMCHVFLQIAKLYVDAKINEAATQLQTAPPYLTANGQQLDMSTMTQFDPYLSALGLVPNAVWPMTAFPGDDGADGTFVPGTSSGGAAAGFESLGTASATTGMGNFVQDWFSGSRYIMGLMEDDIQMPDWET